MAAPTDDHVTHDAEASSSSSTSSTSSSSSSSSLSSQQEPQHHTKQPHHEPQPLKRLSAKHTTNNHRKTKVPIQLSPELISAVRVCVRSYGVGYVFATAPKLIKTLIAFVTNPRKAASASGSKNVVAAFIKTLLTVLKNGASTRKDGMSMLLMITLGGYKLLEVFLNRGMKKVILQQHLQRQRQESQIRSARAAAGVTTATTTSTKDSDEEEEYQWTRNDADKIELASDLRQRITMMASFLSSAAAIVFMHRNRAQHATIDYSLFAVVRALDVFGHVAVKKSWGPSWLGSYGAVAVFVLSCTEIMFSWLYAPERLPGPYAFWITRMGRMDKRLLETLRGIKTDTIQFTKPNSPAVSNLLIGLCEDAGLDPKMGNFELRRRIPCEVVHQGITKSCEVHAGYRWAQGFAVSTGIYLPVHLLPALLSPKAFLDRLRENPVATVSSTLLATARSSAFLATYIALIWYGICTWRSKVMPLTMKVTGKRYTSNVIDHIYGPLLGSFLCGFSVLIEKPHRRAEMALYVLPRAMYSMWSRVMSGRLSRRAEMTGEALMYAVSMSVLLTGIMWNREMVRPSMQGLLGWMLEIKRTKRSKGHHHHGGKGKEMSGAIEDKDALAAVERERSINAH
ncbi:hypothetical protein BGZ83_011328 [Gryganskiella cystojenkinii]|nr:hypothetical protein BGZ83_011328 [Gryganskiella cystojenkinii]